MRKFGADAKSTGHLGCWCLETQQVIRIVTSVREVPGLSLYRHTDSSDCFLESPRGSSRNIAFTLLQRRFARSLVYVPYVVC